MRISWGWRWELTARKPRRELTARKPRWELTARKPRWELTAKKPTCTFYFCHAKSMMVKLYFGARLLKRKNAEESLLDVTFLGDFQFPLKQTTSSNEQSYLKH